MAVEKRGEWKMRKHFITLIAGIVIGAMAFAAMPAMASTGTDTITAAYNNIKIYVNQVLITPKDAAGNEVEPFIYAGTTFLPVRAVSEALGQSVSWDNETKSVYIGTQPPTSEVTAAPALAIVSAPATVRKNEDATIAIAGKPNTEYKISVVYASGTESTSKDLAAKTSNAAGSVSWTWHIGGNTGSGEGKAVVTGAGESVTHNFTVEE
jgi:hypothetical protein